MFETLKTKAEGQAANSVENAEIGVVLGIWERVSWLDRLASTFSGAANWIPLTCSIL